MAKYRYLEFREKPDQRVCARIPVNGYTKKEREHYWNQLESDYPKDKFTGVYVETNKKPGFEPFFFTNLP